jgi:transformation/transcription domain-associated protein
LRTSREDFSAVRKQQQAAAAARRDNPAGRQSVNPTTPSVDNGANNMDTTETPKNDPSALAGTSQSMDVDATASNAGESADGNDPQKQGSATPGPNGATVENAANRMPRQPWEFVDEIVGILKTAFPLLSLTLETMVDQIGQRFKPSADEELFRFISALLGEGVQVTTPSIQITSIN